MKPILLPSPIGGHNNIATDHVPNQRPFSSDALPKIVVPNNLSRSEADWVFQSDGVDLRPLCFGVAQGILVNLLRSLLVVILLAIFGFARRISAGTSFWHEGRRAGAIVDRLPQRQRRSQWYPLTLCCRRYWNTAHPAAWLAGDLVGVSQDHAVARATLPCRQR